MAWLLSRSVLRCQRRRAGDVLRAWPLVGALALVLAGGSPLVAWRAGRALGELLQPVLDDARLSMLLVLGPLTVGAAAGTALCLTAAGRRALGTQLAALPAGARSVLVATMVVPVLVVVALALPVALAFAVPFGEASPGGPVAGMALVAGAITGVAVGAAAAESALHIAAGAWRRGLCALCAVAATWPAAGWLQDAPLTGPLAATGTALAGDGHAPAALASALIAALLYGAAWLELAARRPERHPVSHRLQRPRVFGPAAAAVPAAAVVLLGRRGDVRLALLAAAGLGLGGVALAERVGLPEPAPLHLAASGALLAAALAPLVVGGLLASGRWAWACAPHLRVLPCAALAAAALAVLVGALVPLLIAAALVSGASPRTVGEVLLVAVGLGAAAVLAGALVPWRGAGMGDQVASFAALAVCASAISVAVGTAGPRLVAAGVPDAVAAVSLLAVCAGVSLGAAVLRLCAEGRAA